MVVGVFPALKLGVLFIKQISKPLAKVLTSQAKNHPVFRTYFIIPPAQFYHWAEVKAKMYLMNLGKPTKVAKLNEAMAIELGANLMGEVIIFGVAGACLILEYNRQVAKETKKEEARLEQLKKFSDDIELLLRKTARQSDEIRELAMLVDDLARQTRTKLPAKTAPDAEGEGERPKDESGAETEQSDENASLLRRAIAYFEKVVRNGERIS